MCVCPQIQCNLFQRHYLVVHYLTHSPLSLSPPELLLFALISGCVHAKCTPLFISPDDENERKPSDLTGSKSKHGKRELARKELGELGLRKIGMETSEP